ncbi:MAG: hypothetical protein ACRD1K_01150, partial [Acidimicrobiales bacterium]
MAVMGKRKRRVAFAILVTGLGLLVSGSEQAIAAPKLIGVLGGAFGEQVNVGPLIVSGPMPSVNLPPGGDHKLATVGFPGVLQASVLRARSEGSVPLGYVASLART